MTSERGPERELSALLTDLYVESAPVLPLRCPGADQPGCSSARAGRSPNGGSRRRSSGGALGTRVLDASRADRWPPCSLLVLGFFVLQAATRPPTPPPFGIARNGEIVYATDGDVYVREPSTARRAC